MNFLSEWCEVEVSRGGHLWQQEYERGVATGLASSRLVQTTSDGQAVHVVPTVDPAAANNLEYLSFALRARVTEGRKPSFSLEPALEAGAAPEVSRDGQTV